MNKILAEQIFKDLQTTALKKMEAPQTFLQPFSPAYIPVPISEEHFIPIVPKETKKTFLFIDGGNAEILKTPEYSLQFIRIGAVGFQGTKRILQKKKEGYLLVKTEREKEGIILKTKGYGSWEKELMLELSFTNPLLAKTTERTRVSSIAQIWRSIQEILFAKENLQEETVVLLDRTLLPENTWEEQAFKELQEAAGKKTAIVCGLNKTTALLCNTGESIIAHLHSFQKKGRWLYYPVFSTYDPKHNAVLCFVRLHPKTAYAFRLEIEAGQKEKREDIVSWIAGISNDGVFLGYPYGLIVADQLARVSNREKEYMQTIFFSRTGKKSGTHALDAHEILDRMS